MQIRPVGAELFHEDGWTDGRIDWQKDRHDKTNSRLCNFANAPMWSLMAVRVQLFGVMVTAFAVLSNASERMKVQ
jgi:hypothetical protein